MFVFLHEMLLKVPTRMLREAQQKINDDLAVPGEWLAANKLSTNLIKTEYMILATAPKLIKMNFSLLIKLNAKPIKRVSTSDYLGLIIDKRLSWQQYISSLKLKISSALMALRQVAFLPEKSKITLYHSLIESRLGYCSTVWGNCSSELKINYSSSKIGQQE